MHLPIWGYWNFRLEFVMPYNHNTHEISYDCDIITAFIEFYFALVFTRTFTECVTYITKYVSSTGIMNFGRVWAIL